MEHVWFSFFFLSPGNWPPVRTFIWLHPNGDTGAAQEGSPEALLLTVTWWVDPTYHSVWEQPSSAAPSLPDDTLMSIHTAFSHSGAYVLSRENKTEELNQREKADGGVSPVTARDVALSWLCHCPHSGMGSGPGAFDKWRWNRHFRNFEERRGLQGRNWFHKGNSLG